MGYLQANGLEVQSVRSDDYAKIKAEYGIPVNMRGCHTSIIGDYYVEGHVPVEAIWKLLDERPPIAGIALPGMPSGSPGMGGEKERPFTIYAIVGGQIDVFMTV